MRLLQAAAMPPLLVLQVFQTPLKCSAGLKTAQLKRIHRRDKRDQLSKQYVKENANL